MKSFKSKKEVFEYIKKKYSTAKTILIKGSAVNKSLKDFSDIDVEFYQDKPAKPEYEIALVNDKIVLITAYPYKSGKPINKILGNILVLKGSYCEKIENQAEYLAKERDIRDNQLFLDFLFKYLRTKDKRYLEIVEKYTRLI